MSAESAPTNLTHHFLIAMPGLEDAAFARSVVYLCEHSERGALGLIINKPIGIDMQALFAKVELPLGRADLAQQRVLDGGPVQTERGFVLHDAMSPPKRDAGDAAEDNLPYASTLQVADGLEMTTSRDVLEALSHGAGPRRVQVMLGYSAWGEGQLESEIAENAWLTVHADAGVIFETPIEARYERALGLLGVQPWMLSSEVGRA